VNVATTTEVTSAFHPQSRLDRATTAEHDTDRAWKETPFMTDFNAPDTTSTHVHLYINASTTSAAEYRKRSR
jgi:hypothetical protein